MNKVILMGRLTRDAEIRYSSGETQTATARFTLAVDRRYKQDGQQSADFISCVTFGKTAEFMERFGQKGIKFIVEGRIQTGSYTNREGNKVYTTDVVVENIEFAESKNAGSNTGNSAGSTDNAGASGQQGVYMDESGFMHIPDGVDNVPFT